MRTGIVALLAEGVDRNTFLDNLTGGKLTSPSSRRAWIEIFPVISTILLCTSPSSRRAWIEIGCAAGRFEGRNESPSSRRAWIEIVITQCICMARSASPSSRRAWIEISSCQPHSAKPPVALLAEGVDRNLLTATLTVTSNASPSSRRAWIEISVRGANTFMTRSPSSRRAWIEINVCVCPFPAPNVALLAEGVDRNQTVFQRSS